MVVVFVVVVVVVAVVVACCTGKGVVVSVAVANLQNTRDWPTAQRTTALATTKREQQRLASKAMRTTATDDTHKN